MTPRAVLWTLVCFALLALPFLILLGGERPAGRGFWWDFSMGLGFGALALLALQFALTARLRWISHPFGIDVLYLFHRVLSWGAVALVLGHFAILYVAYRPALGELDPRLAPWELTAGRIALVCFLLLLVTSELRRLLRLEYQLWRYLHAGLAVVGFVAAIGHVLGAGTYVQQPEKLALWLGVTLGFLGLLLWVRLIEPASLTKRPWRVVENRAEGGDVHTLVLSPEGHKGLGRWRPGQFTWLHLRHSPFAMQEHPFTIASAPEAAPLVELSIKPQGDFTAMTRDVRPGEVAYVDGPYGVFSIDRHRRAPGFVMIAGGIGITPMLGNLRAMAARGDDRPVRLLFANQTWADVPFKAELERLQETANLHLVHVLETPPEGWSGEEGRVSKELLARHLGPEQRDWPHFLCGPAPMLEALERDLRALGVPLARLHSEVFELV